MQPTLYPIIMELEKWLYLKGNYYRRDLFLTSMIMGRSVSLWGHLSPPHPTAAVFVAVVTGIAIPLCFMVVDRYHLTMLKGICTFYMAIKC